VRSVVVVVLLLLVVLPYQVPLIVPLLLTTYRKDKNREEREERSKVGCWLLYQVIAMIAMTSVLTRRG
jgi:hypothetical protein